MLDTALYHLKKLIPKKVFSFLQPAYHWTLAFLGALIYRFPSRKLTVIAVTGTKGKSSVTEILNAIFEEAGFKTAVTNTIRFKIGDESRNNLYKMSMPGRMFMQRFLRRALRNGVTHVILEVTSQGAALSRHLFIDFDGLIFTNLAPEHIEGHGSYENYRDAKLSIGEAVARSHKSHRVLVTNADDEVSKLFLEKNFTKKITYSLSDAEPCNLHKEGFDMTFNKKLLRSKLSGEFNVLNVLAAIRMAEAFSVSAETCAQAIEKFSGIRGRVEYVEAGQDFKAVVDYAHTPDSLQKFYDVFRGTRRICVLGNTGGGRDTWKRDEMAHIAEKECDEIILTNEDPYDDDPQKIVNDMATALSPKTQKEKLHIIMDRREAITKALSLAHTGDSVLITGKGTDPYIMGPRNTKIPWSDAEVTREEIQKLTKRG